MPLRLSFESGPLAGIHIVTSAQTIRLGVEQGGDAAAARGLGGAMKGRPGGVGVGQGPSGQSALLYFTLQP